MAIGRVKKLELLILQDDKEKLLSVLQNLGIMELISVHQEAKALENLPAHILEKDLAQIEETIAFMAGVKKQGGLLEGMVKLKPLIHQSQFDEIVSKFDYKTLLKEVSGLRTYLKDLLQRKEKLDQEQYLLSPWEHLSIPLDSLRQTQGCGIFLGTLRAHEYAKMQEDFQEKLPHIFSEVVNQDGHSIYSVIIYLKNEFEKAELLLKGHHFNFVSLPCHQATARERLLEIHRQVSVLDAQVFQAQEKISQLAKEQFRLMAVYDYLDNMRRRIEADEHLAKQRFTFLLSGWIRDKDVKVLEKEISSKFSAAAFFVSDPARTDDIPTVLENIPALRPFEAVTNLYGQPLYRGLDPSGFLAPFFVFSFGFCMLDAGYGLILLCLTLFFLQKKEMPASGKKLLELFLYMSVATIIAGLLAGSFFGDLIERLPHNFSLLKSAQRRITLFSPVKDSLVFLKLVLVFGFIQIWTGVCIKCIRDMRKDAFSAFFLDLPTLCVQSSLLMLVLVFSNVLPAFIVPYAGMLFAVSALLIIFYQWNVNRDYSLKIFWSIFGIYSIVTGNFLADTLSFSRIFALGLTGGLLGMAINTMLLPKGPISGVGGVMSALFSILLLCFGHLVNMAISILGAYVHTSRLQYLEFFTKFFEGTGRPFRPFKQETKYIFLAEK